MLKFMICGHAGFQPSHSQIFCQTWNQYKPINPPYQSCSGVQWIPASKTLCLLWWLVWFLLKVLNLCLKLPHLPLGCSEEPCEMLGIKKVCWIGAVTLLKMFLALMGRICPLGVITSGAVSHACGCGWSPNFGFNPKGHWHLFALQKTICCPEMKADACYLFLTGLRVFNINRNSNFHFSNSERTANGALEIR